MTSTRQISSEVAERAFGSVFSNADPFDEPFDDSIRYRTVLFPVEYEFSSRQLAVIVNAAQTVNDKGVILVFLEAAAHERDINWYIPLTEVERYVELSRSSESALISPTGQWGIMVSHEQHAVLGGNEAFFEAFQTSVWVPLEDQVRAFLKVWKNYQSTGSDVTWVPNLLSHTYGEERAREILDAERFMA